MCYNREKKDRRRTYCDFVYQGNSDRDGAGRDYT